jgi:hypothetical protein
MSQIVQLRKALSVLPAALALRRSLAMHWRQALLAGLCVPWWAAAVAQTGSGTVQFEFTSVQGPIALSTQANAFNPANWLDRGLVNGQLPTPSGWVSLGGDDGYVTGSLALGGTNTVQFQYDRANLPSTGFNILSFAPASFSNVAVGQSFLLGTLTYQNGFWYGANLSDPALNVPTDFGFTMRTVSGDGAAFNQTISGVLRNVIYSVLDDPTLPANFEAEADWVYLMGTGVSASMGAFRVYDNCCKPAGATNVASVEIWGRFNSLDIDSFGAVNGGGFVTSSIAPIPEPGTWGLMLAGLAGVAAAARRRGRARS